MRIKEAIRHIPSVFCLVCACACLAVCIAQALPEKKARETAKMPRIHEPLRIEPIKLEAPADAINVNEADEAELQKLKGIGPKLSAAIVEAREKGGLFFYPEDLADARGIGEKTVLKLKPFISVNIGE